MICERVKKLQFTRRWWPSRFSQIDFGWEAGAPGSDCCRRRRLCPWRHCSFSRTRSVTRVPSAPTSGLQCPRDRIRPFCYNKIQGITPRDLLMLKNTFYHVANHAHSVHQHISFSHVTIVLSIVITKYRALNHVTNHAHFSKKYNPFSHVIY